MNPETCPGRPITELGKLPVLPSPDLPAYLPGGANYQPKAGFRWATVHPRGEGGEGKEEAERETGGKERGRAGRGPQGLTRDECPRGGAARLPGCRRGAGVGQ